jgi:predicted transcriptional regulator
MYDAAFTALREEVSNRHYNETKAAREALLASFVGSVKGDIITVLRGGDSTEKQIAKSLALEVSAVDVHLNEMINRGMVQNLGRHFRFVAAFPVQLEGEEVSA